MTCTVSMINGPDMDLPVDTSPSDTDQDVEKLIDRIENEDPEPASVPGQQSAMSFGFAKIWEADKDALAEVVEEKEEDMSGYWAERLARANAEKAMLADQERTGRGVRRKATRKPMVCPPA